MQALVLSFEHVARIFELLATALYFSDYLYLMLYVKPEFQSIGARFRDIFITLRCEDASLRFTTFIDFDHMPDTGRYFSSSHYVSLSH